MFVRESEVKVACAAGRTGLATASTKALTQRFLTSGLAHREKQAARECLDENTAKRSLCLSEILENRLHHYLC